MPIAQEYSIASFTVVAYDYESHEINQLFKRVEVNIQ